MNGKPEPEVVWEFHATQTNINRCVGELTTLQCTYNSPRIAKCIVFLEQAQEQLTVEFESWEKI